MRQLISPVLEVLTLIVAAAGLFAASASRGQVFEPTSGAHAWNDNANWGPAPPQPFPNGAGAFVEFQAPTGDLSADLGQPITIGSLTVNKSTSGDFDTTIVGSATNTLTFDGGGAVLNRHSSVGAGATTIDAPVVINAPLTVTQEDDGPLAFRQALSGVGGLTIQRPASGEGDVVLNAANSYGGATVVTGNGAARILLLRLNDANSIPGGLGATGGTSHISLSNSAVLGLGAGDFKRSIGPNPDQFQFTSPVASSGWAAYGADRAVNIGGASAPLVWGAAGIGTLTFGSATSDATIDFQNPIDLGSGTTTRVFRAINGTADIDGRISASITSSGTGNLTKTGSGTLSLSAANSYSGNTLVDGGVLVLHHAQALPATTNLTLRDGGALGLGVGDYANTLGTGPGQLQFLTGNGGFAAYGGNRSVTLNGGAPLVWGTGGFVSTGNFILADDGADSMLDFTNAIDLNGGVRTFAARQGDALIDSKLSGVISGGPGSGLNKNQPGTLELAAANSYEGPTTIVNGVLLLTNANSIPGGINGGNTGNIIVTGSGGVIGLGHGNFTSGLGAGAGQVQFGATFNAGFTAHGANRVVNLGGASAPVTWDTGGFVSGEFLISSGNATHTLEFQNPIDLNAAPRIVATRDGAAVVDGVLSGVISGAGGVLEKASAGTLVVTAANTFDGGVTVTGGKLLVNNTTGSGVGTGDVVVNTGATLGGTGFVGAVADTSSLTVNAGGHLAPGASAGVLTVSGNTGLLAGSLFDVELAGPAAGEFDKLIVNGAATLYGTLHIELLDGFTPANGSTYEILTATGGVSGTFAEVTWTGATSWEVQYGPNSATIVATAGYEADYDEDGDVDSDDLNRWAMNFGTGTAHAEGDGDSDGDVDGSDFLLWQRQLGGGVTPPAAVATPAVPEPTGLIIFAFGALFTFLPAVRALVRGATIHWKPGA